jgi:hypothetical protein
MISVLAEKTREQKLSLERTLAQQKVLTASLEDKLGKQMVTENNLKKEVAELISATEGKGKELEESLTEHITELESARNEIAVLLKYVDELESQLVSTDKATKQMTNWALTTGFDDDETFIEFLLNGLMSVKAAAEKKFQMAKANMFAQPPLFYYKKTAEVAQPEIV